MREQRVSRLVGAALRCYPARWRRRHGDEAAEVAMLLIGDGTSAPSIALSYLAGAAREWLTPLPGRRMSPVACALLAATCALGVSAGLFASASPARAASPGHIAGHAHCSTGKQIAAVTPDPGNTRVITGGAVHDRPC